jgi:hypothetical protein
VPDRRSYATDVSYPNRSDGGDTPSCSAKPALAGRAGGWLRSATTSTPSSDRATSHSFPLLTVRCGLVLAIRLQSFAESCPLTLPQDALGRLAGYSRLFCTYDD